MAIYFESVTNRRSANEDSFCHMELRINHEAAVTAMVVADGMGGLACGEIYAQTAVSLWYEKLLKTVMESGFRGGSLEQQTDILEMFSREVLGQINQELYRKGLDAGIRGGTTLSTAIHFWDTWLIANCGDSPVYCAGPAGTCLISEIQNAAWQMVREGRTTEGSLLFHQNKNRLLHYLGRRENVTPYVTRLSDADVDMVLMGSDGAFGDLSPERIGEIMLGCERGQEVIQTLFAEARDTGEEDNQTAIFYQNTVSPAADSERVHDRAVTGAYTDMPGKADTPTLRERLFRRHQAGGRKA